MNDKIINNTTELENYTCGSYLKYFREQKNITLNKASEDLKIIKDILEKIENDDYFHLPPKAYLKGIIKKYARYLNIDQDLIIKLYNKSNGRSLSSGKNDILPQNRFEVKKNKILKIIGEIIKRLFEYFVFILILLYLLFELSQLVLPPKIEILSPNNNFITTESNLEIKGTAVRAKKLYFQGREIPLSDNKEFTEEVILNPGINNFKFEAVNALGKKTIVERQVIYYPK